MKKQTALLMSLGATAVFFLFLLFSLFSFAPGESMVHPEHRFPAEDARLDINSADSSELQQLSGIGPVLGDAIIAWREENGPFHSVEDLLLVPGIGEKTFYAIKDYVVIGGSDEDSGCG